MKKLPEITAPRTINISRPISGKHSTKAVRKIHTKMERFLDVAPIQPQREYQAHFVQLLIDLHWLFYIGN